MIYEFCASEKTSIVLGDFSGDMNKANGIALSKIKNLISGGSIVPEKEEGPFFLKRSEYDFKENRFIIDPEHVGLEINRTDGEVSVTMKTEQFSRIIKT